MSMANVGWWIAASLLVGPVWAQGDLEAEKLRGLGQALHEDLVKRSKPFGNAAAEAYVAGVGGRLVAQLPMTRLQYRFEVLVTTVAAEPVGFANGAVVVPAQFLARVADEAELVRGMAHAMAHTELPAPLLRGEPGTIPLVVFPNCHMDCDVMPIAMRPKWRAIEDEATRFGDDLARRTVTTGDGEAFGAMQKAVRETLPVRLPKAPSLYRRAGLR